MEIPVIRILVISLPEENVAEYVFLQNELFLLELFLFVSARIVYSLEIMFWLWKSVIKLCSVSYLTLKSTWK